MENQKTQPQMQIKATDEQLAGKYCNSMQVSHSRDEFVIDFINLAPQVGVLAARIITNPAHMKRLIMALADNIKKYEQRHGEIVLPEKNQPAEQA